MAVTEERIITRKDKSGNLKTYKRYKSTITLKGFQRISKTFDRKTDADAWGTKTEYEMKHQLSFGPSHHLTKTLEDVINRYLDDLKQTNPERHRDVTPMLNWWKERTFAIFLTPKLLTTRPEYTGIGTKDFDNNQTLNHILPRGRRFDLT